MRLTFLLLILAACSGGGSAPCSPSTCAGCCDSTGVCMPGQADDVCGIGGAACGTCSPIQRCGGGVCVPRFTTDGGASGGSGTAGGSGGTAGGSGTAGGAPLPIASRCAGSMIECDYRCVDPSIDESNCGSCGVRCGAGLVCNQGSCETLPSDCVVKSCPGDFGCNPQTRTCMLQCFSDADCRGGARCSGGTCDCPGYSVACGNFCVSGATTDSSCVCDPGYEGRGECVDVDECARGLSTCGPNATCHNEPGRFSCACNPGYLMQGGTCVVDRCATGNGGCSPNATCDQYGSQVWCQCNSGYEGDGMTCAPVCYPGGTCVDPTLACYPVTTYTGRCERPGSGGPGAACSANTDCASGTRCERMTAGLSGFCASLCPGGSSGCPATEQCTTHDGAYVCLVRDGQPCDALRQNCAGSSAACIPAQNGDVCSYTTGKAIGAVCSYANDCVAGAACILVSGSTTSGVCRKLCDMAAPSCPSGTCGALNGHTYGVCI